ncbi:glycosyltransferase [Brevibacterium aurantiacum]|uniref:Glycosyltransferase 2-like domain-containing protein n=1 Tax=Brevibacterium aurantiacum TaxID=273384 RepID=A0A3Q9NPJ4_BREAU|nr:glycosyltransferase [Brevibacterium aurantiacum]AZT92195.1 hypothetical protein CXR23_02740 [Brevibacterium aurantiacum]
MNFAVNEIYIDGRRVSAADQLPANIEIKFSGRSKDNILHLQPIQGNGRISIDLSQAASCRVELGTGNSIINGTLAIKFPINASRPTVGAFVEVGHLNSFTGSASLQAPFSEGAGISIGSRNLIAPGLSTRGSNHGVYDLETGRITNSEVGSTVGHRNWFGNGVQVFNRCGIGSDSIISFGSLVNKDWSTEDHVVLGGSPAKIIKRGVAWTREMYFEHLDDQPRPALTIGITTYERPKSLVRLLNSIVSQVLPGDKYVEIIVTDDGSKSDDWRKGWDALGELCAVSGYHLIKLRNPAPTGGPSAGRNAAIEVANGSHLMFFDDDDYLEDGALPAIVNALSDSDAERIAFRYRRAGRSNFIPPAQHQERQDIIESLWTMLTPAIYRVDKLRESGCRYPSEVSLGEDSEFVLSCAVKFEKFATLADRDYIVIDNPAEGEASHMSKGKGSWYDFLLDHISHVKRLSGIIQNADLPVYVKDGLVSRVILGRGVIQYQLIRRISDYQPDDKAQELLDYLSEVIKNIAHPSIIERFAASNDSAGAIDAIVKADLFALREAHSKSVSANR